jgi:hypothetical protein
MEEEHAMCCTRSAMYLCASPCEEAVCNASSILYGKAMACYNMHTMGRCGYFRAPCILAYTEWYSEFGHRTRTLTYYRTRVSVLVYALCMNTGLLQGLKRLGTVAMKKCGLQMIPRQLTGLSALTSLDLSLNAFRSDELERWRWWPANLSR